MKERQEDETLRRENREKERQTGRGGVIYVAEEDQSEGPE
jgi:hypothetical protein